MAETTEADELAKKLEKYVLQLRQVEAALVQDPTHIDLIQIKGDLIEIIELTKNLLTEKLSSGGILSKTDQKTNGITSNDTVAPGSSCLKAAASLFPAYGPGGSVKIGVVLEGIKAMGDEAYRDFIFKAFDETRPPDIVRSIYKHLTKRGNKVMRRHPIVKNVADDIDAGNTDQSNGSAGPMSTQAQAHDSSRSAMQTPLIYRGDSMIPEEGFLFMSVKKIRLKKSANMEHKDVGALVCMVNKYKMLVFWSFIKWEDSQICQVFPNKTGITREKIKMGLPMETVLYLLKMAMRRNTLVGYNMNDALEALSISHDRTEDLTEYFRDEEGPLPLENLKYLLDRGNYIVGLNKAAHEARTIRILHQWMQENQSEYPVFSQHPKARMIRKMTETILDVDSGDSCTCTVKIEKE